MYSGLCSCIEGAFLLQLFTSVKITVVRPSNGHTFVVEVLRHERDDGDGVLTFTRMRITFIVLIKPPFLVQRDHRRACPGCACPVCTD